MKSTLRLIITAVSAFIAIASCSKYEAAVHTSGKKWKIGFSQCADDLWRQIMMVQMEAEAAKYPDLELKIKVAGNDTDTQVEQIRSLMDEGIDLLIISPNESAPPITGIAVQAYESGIPTIIWDRKIESDKYSTYISADNYQIGKDVGRYVCSILPEGSSVLEISGLAGSSPARERHQGFIDVIGERYHMTRLYGNWIHDVAKTRVEDMESYEDIDLIFGHNDDMALAAYEAISSRNMADAQRIKFIGIDAIVGVDAVMDGRLEASFMYPPGGEFVISTAMKILYGEEVERTYTLKSSIVDVSNAGTIKMQSEQILNYQKRINAQKGDLETIKESHKVLSHSVMVLVIASLLLLSIATASFITMRKIARKNKTLLSRNKEIEQKTNELLAQNIQIELMANQKLQFFTNISHEIRTPLTLIINPLDKIEKSVKDPSIQNDIRILRHNARHLLKIVTQILDFRKIENNKKVLSVQETDIISFTSEIIRYFETYAQNEKIVYRLNTEIKSMNLWIDRDKMEQVLINLISNAFKHSKKYGIITIGITGTEHSAIIEVHDTGRGMDLNTQQHIFDRFYSVGNAQNHGVGIGLHLSKEYVELHSGQISVRSESGQYTSFFVEIPKGKDHLPEDTVFLEGTEAVDSSEFPDDQLAKEILSKKYDYTILIAEDDDDIRNYLCEELSINFNVISVLNGYEAIQEVLKDNISLVLSDVLMPHINGYQLCREIKSNIATSHIPVVLLTALTDDSQMVHGIAEGADEYIRKPFNIDYVKIKIIRILEERHQLKDAFARKLNADKILDVSIKELPCADDIFRDNLTDYMETNYENSELNVENMSTSLGLSRVQLYRKTKAIFGLSPTDLLRKFRLRKASLLLKDGNHSVSEAAYMCGFSSPAYFTRCFKDLFGVPPTAYKSN